jgi:hypothetical protein
LKEHRFGFFESSTIWFSNHTFTLDLKQIALQIMASMLHMPKPTNRVKIKFDGVASNTFECAQFSGIAGTSPNLYNWGTWKFKGSGSKHLNPEVL